MEDKKFCTLCGERPILVKKRGLCSICYQREWKKGKFKLNKEKIYLRWRICSRCGKRFEVSFAKRYRKTCYVACGKGAKCQQICKQCGKEFEITQFWKDKGTKEFCSRKCVDRWRSTSWRKKGYKKEKCICKTCGIEFEVYSHKSNYFVGFLSKIYCSLRCSKLAPRAYRDNIAFYDTYADQISYAEKVRRDPKAKMVLQVRCTYCNQWYSPNRTSIANRITALNGKQSYGWGESRFYCSNNCKKECPIFYQPNKPKEFGTQSSSREVQPELRQMVFERDNWTCQKCDSKKSLHCHHITGVELNPIESADIDNCITFCKECHKKVHRQVGCTRYDFRREICI